METDVAVLNKSLASATLSASTVEPVSSDVQLNDLENHRIGLNIDFKFQKVTLKLGNAICSV